MGDSRTRAEDRELEMAEERQRQMLAGTPAPSLSRVLKGTAQNRAATGQPSEAEPVDDGPPIKTICGWVTVDHNGYVTIHGGADTMTAAEAMDVWEALTVLIREGVIK